MFWIGVVGKYEGPEFRWERRKANAALRILERGWADVLITCILVHVDFVKDAGEHEMDVRWCAVVVK